MLIAYNWPKDSDRYRRIEKFVEAFFPKLAEFQKPPRHPKWRETNLAAALPGWTRFAGGGGMAATQSPGAAAAAAGRGPRQLQGRFSRRAAPAKPEERERLFQEFLKWSQARERR